MKITILFGTESGNAQLVSEDIADALRGDHTVDVHDMADFPVSDLDAGTLYLCVCSTYGDGELPKSAFPFFRGLQESQTSLEGVRYAVFGLGDSDYIYSYSLGSEIIDKSLTAKGAQRIAEYGRHDAAAGEDPSPIGVEWAREVVAEFAAVA
ncbi:MAG TPA: flavodoxin domain-containing protein [Pseudolysinimonas sp.]|nr:flavodoxin domain-containing protein [Pseudolysinimonas sp.]